MSEKDDYLIDMLVDLGYVTGDQVESSRAEAESAEVGVVDYMVANNLIQNNTVSSASTASSGGGIYNQAKLTMENVTVSGNQATDAGGEGAARSPGRPRPGS